MKKLTFVIIDDNYENGLKTKAVAESFQNLSCLAYSDNYEEGLDAILEYNPDIVFLEIDPESKDSNLSLNLINELYRYLSKIPKIFVTAKDNSLCLSAFKYGVSNYFINPIQARDLRKSIILIEKELELTPKSHAQVTESVVVPAKIVEVDQPKAVAHTESVQMVSEPTREAVQVTFSKTIEAIEVNEDEVLQEEEIPVIEQELNESNDEAEHTEIIEAEQIETAENIIEDELITSDKIVAEPEKEVHFKHVENTIEKPLIICVKSYGDYRYIEAKDVCYLQADNNSTDIHLNTGEMITAFKTLKHFENVLNYPFVRIHNSYIVNTDYVSRIHTGNAVCHIKNTTTKLPFSKSYKENVDAIISEIAAGNYLEI